MKKLIIFFIFLTCLFANTSCWSSTPGQQLRKTVAEVMELVSTPTLEDPGRKLERQNQIFKVIENTFDFSEMARRALGSYYEQIGEREQAEFDLAFSRLVEKTYIRNIEQFQGQKMEVVGERSVGGKYYHVATEVTAGGRMVTVNYFLHEVQGQWLVYDVDVGGVSLVNGYRDKLRATMKTKKFKGLMSMLNEQLKKLDEG